MGSLAYVNPPTGVTEVVREVPGMPRRGVRRAWLLAGCLVLGAGGAAACTGPAGPASAAGGGGAGAPRMITGRESRVPGEYLVTVRPGGDEALVRRLYAPYAVQAVRSLGGDLFLVRLDRDPGPEAIRRKGLESDRIRDVQPNFVYRAGPGLAPPH